MATETRTGAATSEAATSATTTSATTTLTTTTSTMTFEALPDEMIMEIFKQLLDDSTSFRSLMMTSKRCLRIANNPWLASCHEWFLHKPIVFAFDRCLPQGTDQDSGCKQSHHTGERFKRKKFKTTHNLDSFCPYLFTAPSRELVPTSRCFYQPISSLLNAKSITFRSLKFFDNFLWSLDCLQAFHDSSTSRANNLIELELNHCHASLKWLDGILCELNNLSHLILNGVNFYDTDLEKCGAKSQAAKQLKLLRIGSDPINIRTNDKIFRYFLVNFPAIKLDLSGTLIECRSAKIAKQCDMAKSFSEKPIESMLTFYMVLAYLTIHKDTVRKFVAHDTGMSMRELEIIQDQGLSQIDISLEEAPFVPRRPEEPFIPKYTHRCPRLRGRVLI